MAKKAAKKYATKSCSSGNGKMHEKMEKGKGMKKDRS
jgi:hypothetical protein